MNRPRIIALEGVHNFRDFGGWRTQDGLQVKNDLLFRSGHLSRCTPKDRQMIDRLGLQTIADLRQPGERTREPNQLPANAPATILETRHGGYEEAPHLQFLRESDLSVASVQAYMMSAYQRIPMEEHHQQIFTSVFKKLREGKPLLIHCAAGKDRTGILAALILTALGVDQAQVIEDYLLTNSAVDIDALLPSIAKRIEDQTKKPIEPEALRPMLGVEAKFLETAFSTIGSIDDYLENTLGVTNADRTALRNTLTLAA